MIRRREVCVEVPIGITAGTGIQSHRGNGASSVVGIWSIIVPFVVYKTAPPLLHLSLGTAVVVGCIRLFGE